MRLSRQFQASFSYKKFLSIQKASKDKIINCPPLRNFYAQKIIAFVVFCSLVFVFAGWFWLDLRFCTLKIVS